MFAAGDAEGKGVEIVEEVHILHDDLFRHVDPGPREIQDTAYARFDQMVGRALRAFRRRVFS